MQTQQQQQRADLAEQLLSSLDGSINTLNLQGMLFEHSTRLLQIRKTLGEATTQELSNQENDHKKELDGLITQMLRLVDTYSQCLERLPEVEAFPFKFADVSSCIDGCMSKIPETHKDHPLVQHLQEVMQIQKIMLGIADDEPPTMSAKK